MRRVLTWPLMLLLVMVPALSACTNAHLTDQAGPSVTESSLTAQSTESTTTTTTTTTTVQLVTDSNDHTKESGSLRLWWPVRDALNPLMDATPAGQAVYDLIYPGLFRIEADDSLSPAVASNIVALDNGRQVLVAIRENCFFHDGTAVTGTDIAKILEYLIAPDCVSPWRVGLESVESIRVLDERVIELMLTQPDPWIAWALTFPVIPADAIATTDFSLIPGTGPFALTRYDPEEGAVLSAVQPPDQFPLQTLIVREYPDQLSAMRAFERDELDLVLLDTQLIADYAVRSSLRIDHFAGAELLFMACNTRSGAALSQTQKLTKVRQIFQAMKQDGAAFSDWAEISDRGFSAASWLEQAATVSVADILTAAVSEWPDEEPTLVLIVPEQDTRRVSLADNTADCLNQAGISCRAVRLPQEQFWQALVAGDYDLALLAAQLPVKLQPGFLVREPAEPPFTALTLIRDGGTGREDEAAWRQRWQQAQPFTQRFRLLSGSVNPDWLLALTETTARSPWEILCLPYMGLVYGSRVSGQCRPNRYHPYENIEELWTWSGPSSSSS